MQFENRIKEIDELKHKIDKHRPLSKNALEQLKEYYRIGLTYSSNAIEGNSLTETFNDSERIITFISRIRGFNL